MGQQQVLLIVLSVILVGIAISVGFSMFSSYSYTANQDAIVLDIINLSMAAYQHKFKPLSMGGGAGTFKNFEVPSGMSENANASYNTVISEDEREITIIALSKSYDGAMITVTYDLDLNMITQEEHEGGVAGNLKNGYLFQGWKDD